MRKFGFEKLEVWQDSKELSKAIYHETKRFPDEEKFGLISQLRRASISISSNIAEGASRTSPKDQGRFYNLAYSSTTELLNQLILSYELGFLSETSYQELRELLEKVTAFLNRLHQSTQNR